MYDAEYGREYRRDWVKLLKANHLCRDCKKQDARTLNGFVLCWDCQQRSNQHNKILRNEPGHKETRNKTVKAQYDERKAKGLCPACGRERETKRYVMCDHCRALRRKARQKLDTKRRIANGKNWPRGSNGFCWRCNRELATNGRLCESCYADQLRILETTHAKTVDQRRQYNAQYQFGRRRTDRGNHGVHSGQ